MKPVKNTQQIQWAIAENDGIAYGYKKGDTGMILSEDSRHFQCEILTPEGKHYKRASLGNWRKI